ncbi:hypothetical protein SLEP1_g10753 [Rubroshorea leprosula]|uniref:PB1 domain-containing protein n=1 Tax=Rubroshorea leprosula TaxID=152421 RepID=A0AAV5IEZ8_9ROSI|nr:hypothetical protein SLEP1_g10753 [Rubroshorea leprosula]
MCSYAGHVIVGPHSKSLGYVGGETRIVSLPSPTALSVSRLTAHLASTLQINTPFRVRYQLPHHDLDALISIANDDDLQIMLEECERLSALPDLPRIRLFLFPVKPCPLVVQKGENGVASEGGGGGQGEGISLSGKESIAFGMSTSLGSTSSTVSFSNLNPVNGPSEENGQQFQDCKPKLSLRESIAIASDSISNSTSYMSCAQTGTSHQDSVVPIAAMESKVSANPYESDSKIPDLPSGIHLHLSVQVSGCAANPQLNMPQQQNVQIVHPGSYYGPQNPTSVLPMTSYIPVYHPVIQQQESHYQSNQPCPLYYLPVPQTQQYNYPVQCGLVHSSSAQPQMHSNPSGIPPQLVLKEVGVAPPPVPELSSQAHRNVPTANQVAHVKFGSTSSSVSFSNLPPIKGTGEENGLRFQDCKPKLSLPESIASDSISNSASYMSCAQTGTRHQDSVVPIAAMESKVSANPYESDSKIADLTSGTHLLPSVQVSGYAASPQLNLPQQQNVQTVHAGSHYGPQNASGVLPMTSYIPVYHPVIQPQLSHYQSNGPCPLYYLPVPQTQQCNYPMQWGLVHSSFASAQPQMHSNASGIPPQLDLKEVGVAAPPVPELSSQANRNVPTANQVVHTTYCKTEQDPIPSQIHHQPQSFALASGETTN